MKTTRKPRRFDLIEIGLASPEDILSWSYGELKNAETINYRTQKSEKDGLFCEKIFGPEQDFQCSCGKYKGSQHYGVTCNVCDVEVTKSSVRRERMGHIDLGTPIVHIWYLRKTPSRLAQLLGFTAQNVQKVIYHSAYLITKIYSDKLKKYQQELKVELDNQLANSKREETRQVLQAAYKEKMKLLQLIKENEILEEGIHYKLKNEFGDLFESDKGGNAIYNLLKSLDLKKLEKRIVKELENATEQQSDKLNKQLSITRWFINSKRNPEWMFFTKLPVIPAALRPLISLDGGVYVSSDLNDLYRLVILRNNRLKSFVENKAPSIFVETQKRLIQEAVDLLLDGSIQQTSLNTTNQSKSRQLKSIAEKLPGKHGYFRANLLGKRADYSGRSVIVVGPQLKLDECGVPKEIALELFKPFIIGEIIRMEHAHNIRGASRLIDDRVELIWGILDKVIKNKHVLLNRQPTLHRQGIMAFKPVLVDGKAIELHPLVCEPYNADFDGDTMAIHLPLSDEAQLEAREIMLATKNVINPGNGEINISPAKLDIILGIYWATRMSEENKEKKKTKYFSSINEAILAYDTKILSLREKMIVLLSDNEKYGELKNKTVETSVGRLLFNNKLPEDFRFVNETIKKSILKEIINEMIIQYGVDPSVKYFDGIKDIGFHFSTLSGATFAWSDLFVPKLRGEIIKKGREEVDMIENEYNEGLLTYENRKEQTINIWQKTRAKIVDLVAETLPESSVKDMLESGARGSLDSQVKMVGMIGLVDTVKGANFEQSIVHSLKDGLNPIEYFNFAFGGRKGIADTALLTAPAGYLSRRLFDVAQEINIELVDCGTSRGFNLYKKGVAGSVILFSKKIIGRYSSEDIVGKDGLIVKKNHRIDNIAAKKIEKDSLIEVVKVRSPITCTLVKGICSKCYGDNKTNNKIIDIGEAAGTIAAQSIGEPGTQLTMRTFHSGGVASIGGDITAGLPRVIELFDRKTPKALAILAHANGEVASIEYDSLGNQILTLDTAEKKVNLKDKQYFIPKTRLFSVKVGDKVSKGQFLTDGSADLQELLKYIGKEKTQEYIFKEIVKVYELQGTEVSPVHFEIIIRQMFSRLKIKDRGDSIYTQGEIIELSELVKVNDMLEAKGKNLIKAENLVSGIINVSTTRTNFLSSASFQYTTSVLIKATLQGAIDTLDGLKENVIIGRLVPIGTAFEGSKKYNMVQEVVKDVEKRVLEIRANKKIEEV